MTAPTIRVELGYGSTWKTEPSSITWTDETSRVNDRRQMVEIVRGASSTRGEVDTGTLDLTLNNRDRRFDPTHAAGDLFGLLLPGVPVRVRAVIGSDIYSDTYEDDYDTAATVDVWAGTVSSWPQRYDQGNTMATVPITAYDRFDKLSRAKIARSVLEQGVIASSATGYWPLDETAGTEMGDRSGRRFDGVYTTGTTALSTDVGIHRGIDFDGEHYGSVSDAAAAYNLDRVEVVIDLDDADLVDGQVCTIVEASSGQVIDWNLYTNVWVGFEVVSAAAKTVQLRTIGHRSAVVTLSGPTHLAFDVSPAAFYVNGTAVSSSAVLPADKYGAARPGVTIGRSRMYNGRAMVGKLAQVAFIDTSVGGWTLAERVDAALAPLDGQTSGERAAWVLDELGLPLDLQDLALGQSILGPATFQAGEGLLGYLRLIEDTEDGLLFVDTEGRIVFRDRYWRFLEPVATISQFTFTDQLKAQGYAEFQLDLDDELLVNVARFTRRNGIEQVAVDQTSIDLYGEAEMQRSGLLSTTDAQVRSLAEWTVSTRSVPLPRVPKIRVPLHSYSAADQEIVLGLDLGHRVGAIRIPQGVGDPIDLDFIVEGVRHTVAFAQWWVDLYVSPVPQDTVELFLLGSSELGGTHILAH